MADLPEPVAVLLRAADDHDTPALPSHFSFRVTGDRVSRMTIRA